MNSKLKDVREVVAGFFAAFGLGAAVIVIALGVLGFFDHGTTYKYPGEQRVRR